MPRHDVTSGRRPHLVRPRWVWGGVLLAITGVAVLGVGIILLSTTVSVVGVATLLVGTATALRGGVIYDAGPRAHPREELEEVEHGDSHEGVAPGEMEHDHRAEDDAVRTTLRTDQLLRSRPSGVPPLAPLAGWSVVGLAAVVVLAQPFLVGHTATGQDAALRDGGLAVLMGLAGIRIATTAGRHPAATGLVLLAGTGMLLGGSLAPHDRVGMAVLEVGCGCLAVAAALLAATRPRPAD